MASENTIFIQIASYRDPELKHTIKDCLSKAKYPENLRFAIAWQHDNTENLDRYLLDSRFQIIDIPYYKSNGACWARNLLQKKFNNEKFTLQIDSHHRFVKNWDEKLILMHQKLVKDGYKKPVLTAYLPSYDPEKDPDKRINLPWKMNFDRFTPEGVVFFLPASIDNFEKLSSPIRSRFYSAHFCFAPGSFVLDVPHDPLYYFHGEEISISARAFTHGYDLFHPHQVIAWHEYTRKNRTKHWDDDKYWHFKNNICHARNRKLLGVDGEFNDINFKEFGLGKKRSLKEYEIYAGICFNDRSVSKECLQNIEPKRVVKLDEYDNWRSGLLKIFKHCVNVPVQKIPKDIDYDFWYVGFFDPSANEIYRQDVTGNELEQLLNTQSDNYQIWRTFTPKCAPFICRIWPHSKSNGWLSHIDIKI